MIVYDVSMQIHEDMPVYNNNSEKKPIITIERDFVEGKGVRETRLSINLHSGTHVDAPLHMVHNGTTTTEFEPEKYIIKAKVVDLTFVEGSIKDIDLKTLDIESGDFLVFKTRNSFFEGFDKNFVFISECAADYLIEKKIKGVGIDALGIERSQPGHPSHVKLMSYGAMILEGLRLSDVPVGEYLLLAIPLKIKDVEASPVRAILIEYPWLDNFLKGEK